MRYRRRCSVMLVNDPDTLEKQNTGPATTLLDNSGIIGNTLEQMEATPTQEHLAQITIARFCKTKEEAQLLWEMLGIMICPPCRDAADFNKFELHEQCIDVAKNPSNIPGIARWCDCQHKEIISENKSRSAAEKA